MKNIEFKEIENKQLNSGFWTGVAVGLGTGVVVGGIILT